MAHPTEQPQKVSAENKSDEAEIIIIDDDPGFSFMLKDYLLSAANLKSELFSNGNEFLKVYRSGDNRKIILDYDFKEGPNGLFILKKIKTMNPMAIVILFQARTILKKLWRLYATAPPIIFSKPTKQSLPTSFVLS